MGAVSSRIIVSKVNVDEATDKGKGDQLSEFSGREVEGYRGVLLGSQSQGYSMVHPLIS